MVRMSIRSGYRPASGLVFGLLAVLASVGCETNSPDRLTAVAAVDPPAPRLDLRADAGVPVNPTTPAIPRNTLAGEREFGSRDDPFSLMGVEQEYENAQRTEFFLGQAGGFGPLIGGASLAEVEVREIIEPVPLWRLSGVIIGNGVLALLDTGDVVHEVRPGSKVPNTEWTVVSIDSDRAVLRREGNKLPREFAVNLQGPIGGAPPVVGAAGGVGGPGGPGGAAGPPGGGAAAGPPRGQDDRDR